MRRRRCCVCGELFRPDPRVGKRQKACRLAECQQERHRRACQAWREHDRGEAQEERLRRRLGAQNQEVKLAVVRDECGSKIKVVIEECLRLVVDGARDELGVAGPPSGREPPEG